MFSLNTAEFFPQYKCFVSLLAFLAPLNSLCRAQEEFRVLYIWANTNIRLPNLTDIKARYLIQCQALRIMSRIQKIKTRWRRERSGYTRHALWCRIICELFNKMHRATTYNRQSLHLISRELHSSQDIAWSHISQIHKFYICLQS